MTVLFCFCFVLFCFVNKLSFLNCPHFIKLPSLCQLNTKGLVSFGFIDGVVCSFRSGVSIKNNASIFRVNQFCSDNGGSMSLRNVLTNKTDYIALKARETTTILIKFAANMRTFNVRFTFKIYIHIYFESKYMYIYTHTHTHTHTHTKLHYSLQHCRYFIFGSYEWDHKVAAINRSER